MKPNHLPLVLIMLLGVGVMLSGAGDASGVKLEPLGRFAVSMASVPGGTTIKIRLVEPGSFPGVRIVVAELAEGRVKTRTPGAGNSILREWTLKEATSQPVMVYQTTNSSWIGIGLLGAYVEPREESRDGSEFQRFSFPSFSDRMVLDIKVVEPEF